MESQVLKNKIIILVGATFLLSDMATNIQGQMLTVDRGGYL